jgi:hypothetical protein
LNPSGRNACNFGIENQFGDVLSFTPLSSGSLNWPHFGDGEPVEGGEEEESGPMLGLCRLRIGE